MLKRICVLLTLACALLTSGCAFFRPDRIHYTWQENAAKPCVACKPAKTDGDFIAVALSGGGARASVFGAAAIEALTEAG